MVIALPVEALVNSEMYDQIHRITAVPSTSYHVRLLLYPAVPNSNDNPAVPNSNPHRQEHNDQSNTNTNESLTASPIESTGSRRILMLQWNDRGLWANHSELSYFGSQKKPISINLQEMKTASVERVLRGEYEWKLADHNIRNGKGMAGLGILKEVPHHFYAAHHVCCSVAQSV